MPIFMEQRATGRRRLVTADHMTYSCLQGGSLGSQQLSDRGGCTICRSQNTYPTSAGEYELEKEIGKGACGTVSTSSYQLEAGMSKASAAPQAAMLCIKLCPEPQLHL